MNQEQPQDKLYPCCDYGGCGLSKSASAFYKEYPRLCSKCVDTLARKYDISYNDMGMLSFLLKDMEEMRGEIGLSNSQTPQEELVFKKYALLFIDASNNHPMEYGFFQELREKYRNWLVSQRKFIP